MKINDDWAEIGTKIENKTDVLMQSRQILEFFILKKSSTLLMFS